MRTTTIIFALTIEEAKFAFNYMKKHLEEEVKIFAPTLPIQNFLRKYNVPHQEYFLKELFNHNYFSRLSPTDEKKAVKLTSRVIHRLSECMINIAPYIYPLQDRLEFEFFEALDTYRFFKTIEKAIKPTKYYIAKAYKDLSHSQFSIYSMEESRLALLSSIYIPSDKLYFYSPYSFSSKYLYSLKHMQKRIFDSVGKMIRFMNIYVYHILDSIFLKPLDDSKKAEIVLFSSGKVLYYYHNLIDLFKNHHPKIKFHIISSYQLLEEELILRQKNIKFIPLHIFYTRKIRSLYEEESKKVTLIISDFFQSLRLDNIIHERIPPMVKQALLVKTRDVVKDKIKQNIKQYFIAKKILGTYKPKVLITSSDPGPQAMPLVLVAKEQGLKTVVMMHGFIATVLGVNYKSDHILVWGNYFKNWYQSKLGKNSQNVHALGFPMVDELLKKKNQLENKIIESFPRPDNVKVALLLTMCLPNPNQQNLFLEDLFKQISYRKKKYIVYIRSHSGQDTSGVEDLANFYKVTVLVNPSVTAEKFVKDSDMVLSWDTTAILWAMIYKKPLYYCSPLYASWGLPIKQLGGAWILKSVKDILEHYDNLKNNPSLLKTLQKKQKNFLKKVLGVVDGTASEKHFQFIIKLLKEKVSH